MTDANGSRLPGLHRLTPTERRALVAARTGVDAHHVSAALDEGLSVGAADQLVENVLGTYALPFAVAANFVVNGRDVIVPMVVEEPSVVAAASNAARLVRAGGGFRAETDAPIMAVQIQLFTPQPEDAITALRAAEPEWLAAGSAAVGAIIERGGGPRDVSYRAVRGEPGETPFVVVHVYIDVRDAMGANLVNTFGEAAAPVAAARIGARTGLKILTNLADRRKVRAVGRVPVRALDMPDFAGEAVRDGIVEASRFAELDVYRAATHNKGIFNAMDAVVLATGNDWRAVEAGGHAYAARDGGYAPLAVWRTDDASGDLVGRIELPMALGIVGGATRVHPGARLAMALTGVDTAADLACIVAAAGLAGNLGALRALATEGIQKGHMRLHGRSRALAGP